nr:hypothetical protein [Tanacetum cinerariifolium]
MPIPDALLTDAIKRAPYYGGYQAHVAEYQKYLEEERSKAEGKAVPKPPKAKVTKPKVSKPASDTAPKPTSSQPPKPTHAPTGSTKIIQGKATKNRMLKSTLKLVDEFVNEGVPVKEPAYLDEETDIQQALELSLKEQVECTQGPARLMTPKRKTQAEQFIFQRRTSMITGLSRDDKSLSLDAESELADSEMEFDKPDISTKTSTSVVNFSMTSHLMPTKRRHAEAKVELIVTVTIQQDTSSVPPMQFKAHEDHKNLYEALQNSLECEYLNQFLADLNEARRKKRKKHESPRTPSGSPHQQPPPPPPAGASSALGTSRTSGSSQPPPPPPTSSTGTSRGNQRQGSEALSLSKTATSTPEISNKSATLTPPPTDTLMHDDSTLDAQVHLSDDKATRDDHLPKADIRKDWWKPIHETERPASPKPAWTIPSSNMTDVENNWAIALASTYIPPTEHSLLAKIGDMITFMNWYCQQVNKTELTQADLEGQAYEVIKAFHPDVVHLYAVRILAFSRYGYDYLKEIVLRIADYQEYTIAEKDFKNLYPSEFEDLNLLLLQGHLDHLSGSDKCMLSTTVNLWTRNLVIRQQIYKFSDGTLMKVLEALDYRVKEYKVNRLNPGNHNEDGNPSRANIKQDLEKYEHAGLKVTTSHGGNTSQQR